MESSSPARGPVRDAALVVVGPDGGVCTRIALRGGRVTVGRLRGSNDIALEPDPQRLVTRVGHCALECDGAGWMVVDGDGVNGTFVRRHGALERVRGAMPLSDGDRICVLASVEDGRRRFFELVIETHVDSQATLPALDTLQGRRAPCLRYDAETARLLLALGDGEVELALRPQAHRLVAYMAGRNARAGVVALCSHDELIRAVWGDQPFHRRVELARLFWELRRELARHGTQDLVENVRRLGYRLHTCGCAG
jgi:Transcriptional regulatory protein, C terminal/FHA domain